MDWGAGHTVVVVPVGELEPFVLARTRHYDEAWVSTDPAFTHAHVTLLAPWVREPSRDDLAVLGAIAATTPPFEFSASHVQQFPDGTIHLPADPPDDLSRLMRRIADAFPQHPPYGGAFGSIDTLTPHVTLDRAAGGVTVRSTQQLLADLVPTTCAADRIEVHWYAERDCRVLASFDLAPIASLRR